MKSLGLIVRRGLRREEAASYVGLSASLFSDLVRQGTMPEGVRIRGARVWDVRDLDAAFDRLKGEPEEEKAEEGAASCTPWEDLLGGKG